MHCQDATLVAKIKSNQDSTYEYNCVNHRVNSGKKKIKNDSEFPVGFKLE